MWIFGIILAIFASLCGTCGKQLFRYAELQRLKGVGWQEQGEVAKAEGQLRFANRLRLLGVFVIALCGPLLDMASYAFAAQSMIAPFAGTDIVANMLLAPYTLGEKWTVTRILGGTFVAIGTVSTAFFGPQEHSVYTRDYVVETIFSVRVLVYMLCLSAWVGGNILFHSRRPFGDTLRGLSLGVTAGTLAGNMFCVKATVELIEAAGRDGFEVWLHWAPWICAVGAALFALSNLRFMEQGMREQEALLMGTLYEGSLVLSGCMSGIIVLRELDNQSLEASLKFLGCVVVIFTGVCILWYGELKASTPKKQDEEDPEQNSATATSETVGKAEHEDDIANEPSKIDLTQEENGAIKTTS